MVAISVDKRNSNMTEVPLISLSFLSVLIFGFVDASKKASPSARGKEIDIKKKSGLAS